ncbi:hypothetical protein GCM10023314_21270 [Algibacter agarivorans]|uniref:Uncharacterized protein n=1 Tax=Algibacter agarivorans TaxID=1109741 RepID=A0ABP9GLV7_9FLAO
MCVFGIKANSIDICHLKPFVSAQNKLKSKGLEKSKNFVGLNFSLSRAEIKSSTGLESGKLFKFNF